MVTPLFVVLVMIETTDIMFALDSIPAVFGVTLDPFIAFSSNAFAILGLRAMYFALAGLMELLRFLNYGLALILVFIGVKMIAGHFYEIPILWTLGVIGGILAATTIASVLYPHRPHEQA
jgi:tellurite resistance protein TerC